MKDGWRKCTNNPPKRQNVADGTWQEIAPKLLGFMRRTSRHIRNGKLSLTLN